MQTLTFENFSDFKKEVGFNQMKLQVDGNLFTIVNPSDPTLCSHTNRVIPTVIGMKSAKTAFK